MHFLTALALGETQPSLHQYLDIHVINSIRISSSPSVAEFIREETVWNEMLEVIHTSAVGAVNDAMRRY